MTIKKDTMPESKSYFRKKLEPLMKPYRSDAQRRWAHTEAGTKALGGDAAVSHWDKESKGKDLPERVAKDEAQRRMTRDATGTIGVHHAGHQGPGVAVQRNFIDPKNRVHSHRRNLRDLKAMPKPNLPKAEMSKAEMPRGAGQPQQPAGPKPPKAPIPPSNAPAASAAKQAQSAGKGGYTPPKTPGAQAPKNPSTAPKSPKAAKPDYFKSMLKKPVTKSEKKWVATEEQLYKTACPDCGTPEFKKGADGNPTFNPCACFLVLKKDENGNPCSFVNAIRKTDGTYSLEFEKNADPEVVKAFLLTLKARLLIKKNHGM